MKKSIFLFFAAILCAIGMNAATWTVAGDNAKILNGTSTWDPGDTKNDMTNVSGTKWGLLVMNKSLAKTTYKFKVCKDHGWGTAYPGSDYNFTIGAAGTYNIIYRFNTNGNTVKADYFKTWTVAGSGAVLGDDWKPEATANDMTRNGNTFEYVLTKKDVKLEKGTTYECKVCKDHAWGTAYPSQNQAFSVSTTGYYDVTFKFNVATETVTVTTTLISCKVTTSANPTEGGSVTATKEYAKGSSVTLTATPAEGYEFVNWTKEGSVVSTSKAYTFTVLEDVSLVANFKIPEPDVVKYQITVSANNPTMGTVTGSGEYEEGTTALLTATPNSGYLFKKWTVGGAEVSAANPYTFTVNADVTVVANFEETPKETVYFVNNGGWASVSIYGWGGSVTSTGINQWAGVPMTKTGETLTIGEKSYDIYSYSAEVGAVKNILFNYNGDANKTSDFVWTDGKYYYNGAAANYAGGTKEEVTKVLTPTYTVAGDNRIVFGEEWAPAKADNDMVDQGDGTYKWTKSEIALKKNTQIKFKVVKNHDWEKGSWPGEDWVINTITKDGYYTITITFKESDQSITATATWTGEAPFKDFSNQPATLYFHPSFHWTSDNAEFAAYFYNEGFGADAEPTWANMTDSNGDGVYEVTNAKQHEYVIICRMNPSRTENNWNNDVKWNQIESGITIPNTAGNLNTCLAFWTNCQGDVPTSECTWVAPTPLTDKNWDAFIAAYNGKTINAVVERSFKHSQYHTLCLPFDIPTNWLGEGTEAYQLTSIVANNTGDKLSLNATKWETIVAGQPYIIKPVKGDEYEHVIINNVTVKNASAGTNVAFGDGYKATLKAVTATDGTKTNASTEYYVGANDGKLYNAEVDKLGLRAIIELTTIGGQPLPAKVRAYVAAEENEATGFENIVAPEGQALKVIENGQLIIIRGNEKFNAQGVRL